MREACRHSERALVEQYVELGREVRCGVLEVDGELVCLPLEEYAVDPVGKPVRDHDDKLRRSDDGPTWAWSPRTPSTPGSSTPPTRSPTPCTQAARAAYAALGCRHYGLFDFRVDPGGTPYFLEASLYCSYAPSSVLVVMAAAAGIDLERLFRLGRRRRPARRAPRSEHESPARPPTPAPPLPCSEDSCEVRRARPGRRPRGRRRPGPPRPRT